MNDIIKFIKSLEYLNSLIRGIPETLKHEIKNQESGFLLALLAPLAALLLKPVISSAVEGITGRRRKKAGRGYIDRNFYFRSIL